MTINTLDVHRLVDLIDATDGDKPESYRLAKMLRDEVDRLIKATQPGAGEFKWSAKAVKALTNPAYSKQDKPFILIAREGDEVWHTNGHYMKRGEAPKRMGELEVQDLPIGSARSVIPQDRGDEVTILGSHNSSGDNVALSDGAVVNRVLITYVMDGYPGAYLRHAGAMAPVTVMCDGEPIGLVMPIRQD